MIKFNKDELRDKINACWVGKNIGGTLGGPFEGVRKVLDCTGFTTEPGKPLPNDDLDLQLIWLTAMRELGPNNVNAQTLGEYWMEYITPFWNEYGICKANMLRGMLPPMCGQYKNHWKHSNGAWIRTEVWATLYPGLVEKAIYYASEDACVDHGSGEGTYAAIFVAALESAAFIVSDIRQLIDIGLSKIPENSRMYKYITTVVECYDKKMTWLETRNLITQMSQDDKELGWFQSPANVGYVIIGLLYGEGDFKESMLIACNCGDDTDCSCSTVGSILGIIHGMSIIPKDWQQYIGDDIITISINMGAGPKYDNLFPYTCTDLTERIMDLHHITLEYSDVKVCGENTDFGDFDAKSFMGNDFAMKLANRSEYYVTFNSILTDGIAELSGEPEIVPGGSIDVKITLNLHWHSQKVHNVRWLLPEGWTYTGPKSLSVMSWELPGVGEYTITAGDKVDSVNRIVAEITCDGHYETVYVPIVLCN